MNAKSIFENLTNSYLYMERYVNNGSPSGWTQKQTTSRDTNPFTGKDSFPLLEFKDDDIECDIIGDKHHLFSCDINYAHPDSINSNILLKSKRILQESRLIVSPTSGGRTMLVRDDNFAGLIKLTYDIGRIGRVDRQLSFGHCMSSYEVSKAIQENIDMSKFKSTYAVLLEKNAKVSKLNVDDMVYEWGTILREIKPYPYIKETRQIIPGFSLFAKDHFNIGTKNDEYLINQFIELSGQDPQKYLLNVLTMTVDAWFETLINGAFILELHGQNCYYELDKSFIIKRIVIKDMDSVDKDLSLARKLGLNDKWASFPFECFYESEPENHPWYYKIRPSYMFDFKLGTYLLDPIICVVCQKYSLDKHMIEKKLKDYINDTYLPVIPLGYFPEDGSWYYCDNSERKPGEKRKYFSNPHPKFR